MMALNVRLDQTGNNIHVQRAVRIRCCKTTD